MNDDKRAELLRSRILVEQQNRASRKGDDLVVDARSLRMSSNIGSWQLRMGLLTRDRLASLQFQKDNNFRLFGSIKTVEYSNDQLEEAKNFLETQPTVTGQSGHCEPYWNDIFELGIDGLIQKNIDFKNNRDGDTADTYQSFVYALEGLSAMIENAGNGDELCRKIAHKAPETFHEAIQLIWFVMIGIMIGNNAWLVGPGRLDVRLNRFYQRDLKKGNFCSDYALKLIEDLYFLINDFDKHGLSYAVMVGGRDADGNDLTNEVSYLCLEALRRTQLVYPTIGICWHENTPEDLVKLAVELISQGYPNPAFFGDEIIQKGLQKYGVPKTESWDYINSTCVEITLSGSSNIWVASPYFSLCKILLEEIDNTQKITSYDDFIASYFERLSSKIAEAVAIQNEAREGRQIYGGKPLQSVFTRDCMARGRDIDNGGARYNWVECSFVGLANLVDSLLVIKEEVFQQSNIDFVKLKQILDSNFTDDGTFLKKILKYPKYGHDNRVVDQEVSRIMKFIEAKCENFKMLPDDSPFVPGTFCWIKHQQLGALCGATPDGRMAGLPFADGAGPAQGREEMGPTAAINSVTSWDHSPIIGGTAFNMKFKRSLFNSPELKNTLKQLIVVFLKQGGFQTQINVVDNSTLKNALQHPEQHNDLVVRIGGYTDYFTRLSPEMQEEILQRMEYDSI